MFKIQYLPNIPISEWSQMSLEDFEGEEYGNVIYGQLEINVNGQTYGFYDPDAPTPIADFFEECIDAWLGYLNDVVLLLSNHDYTALHTIDDVFVWFEFQKTRDENLLVSLAYVENTNVGMVEEGENYAILTSILTEPIDCVSKYLWREEIKLQEFVDEVQNKTKEFIAFFEKTNPALLKSQCLKVLRSYIRSS
ncbi:hypothetical protein NDK47_02415 [Brevibacillus ruminantium]|uniref:Uncharacterized protein n=1 Tax=Brevibacillus ruminantium TaxID=2950604 RepID=A0ABY4WGC3_9BACL|nr:hypothetical protein [Brevibacillus ruminantium]USG66208.1 hypothetical protein NDK47_02415 [Brevibacillus ruminantium]